MKNFTKNTKFYEYLGMGMGIDTQFCGYWVLSMGWVSGQFEYLAMGMGRVVIPKPIHKNPTFLGIKLD